MGAKVESGTKATGGKSVRVVLDRVGKDLTLTFRANGHKSSDGDGRTAADVRRELIERSQ